MKTTLTILRYIAPSGLEIAVAFGVVLGFVLASYLAPAFEELRAAIWVELVWKRIF